jgi:hypothetical protein
MVKLNKILFIYIYIYMNNIYMLCIWWLLCWCLHLVMVGELEYSNDPESYAASSIATGRVTLGRQVKG